MSAKNEKKANILHDKGKLTDAGCYLCQDPGISNFMVSGGYEQERQQILENLLGRVIGSVPAVIIHQNNASMEAGIIGLYEKARAAGKGFPLTVINGRYRTFEPLFGLADMQIVNVLRILAVKMGYTVSPAFERVVLAHLRILHVLNIPSSLSGLFYLSSFRDLGEFHNNVLMLPCGRQQAELIWADLNTDSQNSDTSFDLVHSVINNLANEAAQNGWLPNNTVATGSIVNTVQQGGTILLSINGMYSDLILPYLAEELKMVCSRPILILLDGIRADETLTEFICACGRQNVIGITGDSTPECFRSDEKVFARVAQKMERFIFLKHTTAGTAKLFSELCGSFDNEKQERSQGSGRGFFSILPRDRHNDIRYSTENRYRLMPEEFLSLSDRQALIFDAVTDRIIRFN